MSFPAGIGSGAYLPTQADSKPPNPLLYLHYCFYTIRSALYSSPAKIEHSPTDFQKSNMYLKTQP